jgi:hypothetical protein
VILPSAKLIWIARPGGAQYLRGKEHATSATLSRAVNWLGTRRLRPLKSGLSSVYNRFLWLPRARFRLDNIFLWCLNGPVDGKRFEPHELCFDFAEVFLPKLIVGSIVAQRH